MSPPRLEEMVSPGHRFLFGMALLFGQFAIGGIGELEFLPLWLRLSIGPLFVLLTPMAFLRWLGVSVRESIALHAPPPAHLGWCLIAGLALVPAMAILGAFNSQLIEPAPWFLEAMEQLEPQSTRDWLGIVLITVLLAPAAEEVLFRGILQPAAAPALGAARAAVVVGLIFAAIHFEPWYLVPLSVIGMLLGLIRMLTGSVISCVVTHGAYNLGTLLLGQLARGQDDESSWFGAGLLMIAAFAGAWLCWFALGRLAGDR